MSPRGFLDAYRRCLQLGLGVIWLLDAALQFQPYMFTKAFPQQALAPAGPGSPRFIAQPVHWAAQLTATHVVAFNALFATTQLLIALGLFTRATVRVALAGSVVWALGVWWMGEGLGGMLAAPQSPIMGSPGAAVLYALVSILIWPRKDRGTTTMTVTTQSVASAGPLGGVGARMAWLVLWATFSFESLQAVNRSPSALHDLIAGMAAGEPGWLRATNRHAAALLAHHGTEVSLALAIGFALIALAVFGGTQVARCGIVAVVILAGLIWVVGQDIGEIASGRATDPNTGPLLILLAATYWPFVRSAVPAVAAETAAPEPAAELATVGR
jgi:hypothetical protein